MCNNQYTIKYTANTGSVPIGHFNCSLDDRVNVYDRFTTILQLYFAFFIIQAFRMLLILICLCKHNNQALSKIFEVLGIINALYGFALFIILQVYRWEPSGRYASGDWMDADYRMQILEMYDEETYKGQYMRGQYLLGLIIYIYVSTPILCCL